MTARAQRAAAQRVRLLSALLAFVLLLGGCRSQQNVVATLRGFAGQVARDHQASVGAWEAANVGATFVVGDAVRTRAHSTAALELASSHQLSLEPDTLIRFLSRPSDPKRTRVALEMGEVTLDAASDRLELETELGTVRVEAHGRARLGKDGDALRLQVTIGAAEIDRDGRRWELQVGDAVEISAQGQLSRVPAGSASAAASPAASASAAGLGLERAVAPIPSALAGPGADSRASFERGLERVDLSIAAGESIIIHDPRPPTAVGVLAGGHCSGSALLSVDGSRAHSEERVGEGRIGIALTSGAHRYVVHCLGEGGVRGDKIGQGTISIVPDAGLRRLAISAPLTNVDTDGRRYTVLYQSLQPRIAIQWPNAPAASSYVLTVNSPHGTKTVTVSSPRYLFASGSLIEGQHSFSFQGAGRRSRDTTVVIRFDNAAPAASIMSPSDGSFAPGSSVLVAGTAQPGSVVTVGGETLQQDAQNRFSMAVSAPSDQALAIRFTQPQRGVHYYLRRSAL
ncbi:MAG: FecR domain-containing protein [Pseudomonadota bacterium]